MDMKHIVWIVTSGIIAILLSVSVLIPVVESSAYTTIDNGESDGMTYDLYETPINKTLLFTPNMSDMTYKAEIWTQPGNVKSEMTGTLRSMYLFASDYLLIFIDQSMNVMTVLGDPISHYATPLGYAMETFTLKITNYDVSLSIGSRTVNFPGVAFNFAYFPTVDGHYGFYKDGGLTILGGEILIGSVFTGDVATYWNGSMSFGSGALQYSEPTISTTGNTLDSISWGVEGSTVTPIEEIDRSSIVTVGNVVDTVTVYADSSSPSMSHSMNITLFDDNSCRINSYSATGPMAFTQYSDVIPYNGTNYTVKIIGNGTSPVFGSNVTEQIDLSMFTKVEVINDYAFRNINSSLYYLSSSAPIKVVGDYAFENSNGFSGNIYDLIWIGDYAFKGTTNITSIYVDSINHIGDHAFEDCTSITYFSYRSAINGIYYIGDYAFKGCTSMSDGIFYEQSYVTISIIGDHAFDGCTNFAYAGGGQSVIFSEYVTSVGSRAFANSGSYDYVKNYSNAEFGEDIFEGVSSVLSVLNLGSIILTEDNIGLDVPIQNGFTSMGYFALMTATIQKEGLVYDLVVLIPLFVVIGMVVGIAVESYRFRT